ncbi:MAG TPA: tetratricopeptide repeat protein [Gemmataceae bacterium]|jgi:tetratricopeptide (TPR) repeat protein
MTAVAAHLVTAKKHHRAGDLAEAERLYRDLLCQDDALAEPWYLLGVLLHQRGADADAENALRQAVKRRPAWAAARNHLGIVLARQQRPDEAAAQWREALRVQPNCADAQHNLGLIQQPQPNGQPHDASRKPSVAARSPSARGRPTVSQLRRAVRLHPDCAAAHNNLGLALLESDDLDGAASSLEQALRLQPDLADAHNNLGVVHWRQGRLEEALASVQEALRVRPGFAEAFNNLGTVQHSRGELTAALTNFEQALALKPDYVEAHANRALALLLQGAWAEGWAEYEWRWQLPTAPRRAFAPPPWDGTPLAGRTILLYAEQGLGDTLQFIRYAPLVQARGGTVVALCPPSLRPLLSTCPGINRLLTIGEALPPFDVHAPLLSLPRLLGTTPDNVPAPVPYLHADEERQRQWRSRLAGYQGFKVGIAWQGDRRHRADRQRSAPLAALAPLAQVPGVQLLSLQKGAGSEQLGTCPFALTTLGQGLDNDAGAFQDSAAVMKQLDLVVCVDTALGHLAGALGVPVWLALPLTPDWRWLLERSDTPWYPTMRLFRQRRLDDWSSVFADMAAALRQQLTADAPANVFVEMAAVEVREKNVAGPGEPAPPVSMPEVEQLRQQGLALFRRGQLPEAEHCLRQALALQPGDAGLHNNLGVVLAGRGQLAEALPSFVEAVRLRPAYAQAHHNRGNALRDLGRHAEAVPCYEHAHQLRPGDANICFDLGVALLAAGRSQDAVAPLRQANALRPEHADSNNRLGQALAEAGHWAEALDSFRRLAVLRPASADAQHNLAVTLARLGRHAEAADAYREALRLRPDHAEDHNNLGLALVEVDRRDEAVTVFRQAIDRDPNYAEAHNNLAITLVALGDAAGGLAAFAEALRLRPDYPKARTNRALALLQTGDFEQGWREYEWRWRTDDFTPRNFGKPRWDGTPLEGRTILLHAEQGLGDTLQFIRYAPLVQQRGGVVLVEAPPRLLPLLERCPGIDRLVARGAALPDFDVEAPLLSLPDLVGTTAATIPAPIPYLSADPERTARWGAELQAVAGFKVGIAWQGSRTYRGDRQRSIALRHFAPLVRLRGVRLVSLQKGHGSEQLAAVAADWGVMELGPRLDEGTGAFVDTAAVVTQLDLVVSSDTSVVHLAGALGAPVWLALPLACDWRWGLTGESTPWYPTMRLFRQRRAGNWDEVFARMAAELHERWTAEEAGRGYTETLEPGSPAP